MTSQQQGNQGNQPSNNSSQSLPPSLSNSLKDETTGTSGKVHSSHTTGTTIPENKPQLQPSLSEPSSLSSSLHLHHSSHEYRNIHSCQQRILLFGHASVCQQETEICHVSSCCASIKRLWGHITSCRNIECNVQHCLSSREILCHYKNCQNPRCPVCVPVHKMIFNCSRNNSSGIHKTSPPPSSSNSTNSDIIAQERVSAKQASPHITEQTQKRIKTDRIGTAKPDSNYPYPSSALYSLAKPKTADSSSHGMFSSQNKPCPTTKDELKKPDPFYQEIRFEQILIQLLYHSAKCPYKTGECPINEHCVFIKEVWGHISHCKNLKCTYPCCYRSRGVLSHYRHCRDPRCSTCEPVRQVVRQKRRQNRSSSGNGHSSTSFRSFSSSDMNRYMLLVNEILKNNKNDNGQV